jgi:PIN domain nuclease of toxin-antitoxin system
VSYLLDTHVLLWWIDDAPQLQSGVRDLIIDPDQDISVSAASIWEAAIKRAIGKLRFDTPALLQALRRDRIRVLPITADHALAAGDLPRHHDDPFDRMLVAQAAAEGLSIVTRDRRLQQYGVGIVHA